ncbi:MAG TPA: response regulator transcription factor [Candidatus Limnocylindria bacterium]|jgi:DNA-binding NarL/FixJ family response regulator|nr:response regulator transcription factor [Candidatus Limnocylindria bacterium]
MIRVLIVDDHAIVRHGLRALLSDEFHGGAFGEASDARQALEQLRKKEWDVALLDIALPGKSGLDLLRQTLTNLSACFLRKNQPGLMDMIDVGIYLLI